MFKNGLLYLVSTPIGNLEDITFRSLRILKDADIIAAEDTRHTLLLLNHFGINHKEMESYHDFNKEHKTGFLIKALLSGKSIALVSDAGTPGISDPAYNLVVKAIESGIAVIPVPGPTAAITALVISGLPTDRYVFDGFLPVKKGRKTRIEQLTEERRTIILYESPHRIIRTLNDLRSALGDRSVAVCRELTKKFEEVYRGSISDVIYKMSQKQIRGEFVLIIKGKGQRD
jgi:16S rRNA (cytidine1402-2'-O)-methyltransferase